MSVNDQPVNNHIPAPYEVGYGRPPVSTRFKKGKSGNPTGRPKKKSKPIGELLVRAFAKPVTLAFGGREATVEIAKALMINLVHRAIKGDPKSLRTLSVLLDKSRLLSRTEDPNHPTGAVFLTEEENEELHAHPERFLEIVRRSRERHAAMPQVETARLFPT